MKDNLLLQMRISKLQKMSRIKHNLHRHVCNDLAWSFSIKCYS